MNGAISTEEYTRVTLNIDTFINVALAIGNAKSALAVAIGTGPITVNGGSGDPAANSGANTLNIGADSDPKIVDAGKGGLDKDTTPAAVAQIVRDFLNYKEDMVCLQEYNRLCRKLATGNVIK